MNRLLTPVALLAAVTLSACNSVHAGADQEDVVTKTSLSSVHDGVYRLDISCDWGDYGRFSINDGYMEWTVKAGRLDHKAGRWDLKGEVYGNRLVFDGTRQSGKDSKWKPLSMWINFNDGTVKGDWSKAASIGDGCDGTAVKQQVAAKTVQVYSGASADEPREFVMEGSKDYFRISDLINDNPVNGNHNRPKVKLLLEFPEKYRPLYPLVAFVPSSQGIEYDDEEALAREFRKLGYATLIIYSYQARQTGGDTAELGKTINSPTVALDAMLALQYVLSDTRIDNQSTTLYGASKGSLSVEETMILAISEKWNVPMYNALLSENSNMCFDFSKLPLSKDTKLGVFTGGKDDSGTESECVKRTQIYASKGYNIKHFIYPDAAHRFTRLNHEPKYVDVAYGYSQCEWLVNNNGDQGYRVKSTGATFFPETRDSMIKSIRPCLNKGIYIGATNQSRNKFMTDAHKFLQN